jgi:hypothetical protein
METEFYCYVHWRPPLVLALSQMNLVKTLIAYKNHFRRVRKIEKSDY